MKVTIKFKESVIKELLKTIVVIYSTKEQENKHILDYFDKKGIKHKRQSMETCDYSAYIPKNEELGLPFDITLEKEILIERKAHLDELSNNICNDRQAFFNEWVRAKESGATLYLVIEKGSWKDIRQHNYRSQYNEKAYYNTLLSWRDKFGFQVDFLNSNEEMGEHILRLIQLKLKKLLEE